MRKEKKNILHGFIALAMLGIFYAYSQYFPYVFMGVFDGLNVCSLTLMALIISLMYNVNAERKATLFLGIVYISGVFFSYFLVGLGILIFSLSLSLPTHIFTKISVAVMISIGILNIISYIRPSLIPSTPTKIFSRRAIKKMRTLTFPSVLMAGMLVGPHNPLCPCTGGIYITFVSLIAKAPFKIIHLISYNFLFVLPLILILYACSSKSLSLKFRKQYAENTRRIKLVLGILMILSSLIIISIID